LEELRRSSLIEVEHLNMPEVMQRKMSNRDMPAHAAPVPKELHKNNSSASKSSQEHGKQTTISLSSLSVDQQGYFSSASGGSSPRVLQTVPEEPSSTESSKQLDDYDHDDLSPSSTIPTAPSVSASSETTLAAEITGEGATLGGKPMFTEPDFGKVEGEELEKEGLEKEGLRRSPGSFSAETAREDNVTSPTER